jgi:hypothetical protein
MWEMRKLYRILVGTPAGGGGEYIDLDGRIM